MRGEEFQRRAGALGLELVRFPAECLEGLSLGAAERLWLMDWGLPRYSPPHLVFGDFEGRFLPRLDAWDWLEAQPPDTLAARRVLGADGGDRPICLPEKEPAVLCLDPQRAFEPVWLNASVRALAACCLACQEMLAGCERPDCVPPERVGRLEREIRDVDPSALRAGAFWREQIQHFLDPLDEHATRHYLREQQVFAQTFALGADTPCHKLRIPIDNQGLGDRSERMRLANIRNLLVLFHRLAEQLQAQGREAQIWIELGEDSARDDAVFIHEAGEPELVFPWDFPGVTWGLKRPAFLTDLVEEGFETGRGGGRWVLRL